MKKEKTNAVANKQEKERIQERMNLHHGIFPKKTKMKKHQLLEKIIRNTPRTTMLLLVAIVLTSMFAKTNIFFKKKYITIAILSIGMVCSLITMFYLDRKEEEETKTRKKKLLKLDNINDEE